MSKQEELFRSSAAQVIKDIKVVAKYILPQPRVLTTGHINAAAMEAAREIRKLFPNKNIIQLYGVPRGGVPAAYAIAAQLNADSHTLVSRVVSHVELADVIVDDLIDSGKTAKRYSHLQMPFVALFTKGVSCPHDEWLVFPWEQSEDKGDASAEDIAIRILQRIGEDVTREGLKETPARYVKALDEWFAGYKVVPESVLKAFEDGAQEASNGIVIVRDIPVYSHCEHHLAPIFGTASVGYIPNGRVVGLSKLKRLVDVFARRLQVQERLTNQVADTLHNELNPLGTGVVIKARHMCMESRGVNTAGSETVTSALRGVFMANPSARAEFMELAK